MKKLPSSLGASSVVHALLLVGAGACSGNIVGSPWPDEGSRDPADAGETSSPDATPSGSDAAADASGSVDAIPDAAGVDAGPEDQGPADATCEPECPPGACGDDGCGGSCGPCPETGRPIWFSGFENGWPGGEWLSYRPSGPMVDQDLGALWDIVEEDEGVQPVEGDHMYKGWITETVGPSHRAYPILHGDEHYTAETYIVNRFYVWADVELTGSQWFHFATWSADPNWNIWTMSILRGDGDDHRIEVAHLWNGGSAEIIDPSAHTFPLRQWVRFTKYIDFSGDGYMRLWMDGVPIFEGHGDRISGYEDWLLRAHWGLYASGSVASGVQYNDSIQIWALDDPLEDLETEPHSPYDGAGVSTPGDEER